ncbi:EscU/YscU/HrcU family type III secretion system export apparatus switch protein [Latilactobacillus curvatus]|uniref:EscU/YscU/HrcU family type III secretion system export apparatus switch protein n=1 Tax=Latilactobacillus curvatus TaxID=28038 RepID=UPI00217D266D|nr:EscU/YscU/HrcU family type III secretion system export apparatus switch protein [Latilactobacillus curvatus]MCS6142191.1 EscU/YscU/HrcU family type III secretion system export apparatus switch protein [Latilactobacillus curvatus]
MDKDGKTEKPTPKRKRDARKKGNVARSPDLTAALALLTFSFIFIPAWQFGLGKFFPYMTGFIEQLDNYQVLYADLPKVGLQAILMVLIVAAPFLVVGYLISFLGNFVQIGFLFTAKPLKPDFKRLNPLSGFKRMFSLDAIVNLGKTLAKFLLIAYLCYRKYISTLRDILNAGSVGPAKILFFILNFCKELGMQIALVLLVLGLADFGYQSFSRTKKLKMTKQEIKEEMKQMEGDPKVKAQRKAKYQAMVRNSIAQVKDATVVLANPTHLALAIKYDKTETPVPQLLAKGADEIAMKMKEEARKNDVPIIENKPLARAIYPKIEAGEFIPEEFFEPVADLIALVYRLDEEAKYKI